MSTSSYFAVHKDRAIIVENLFRQIFSYCLLYFITCETWLFNWVLFFVMVLLLWLGFYRIYVIVFVCLSVDGVLVISQGPTNFLSMFRQFFHRISS